MKKRNTQQEREREKVNEKKMKRKKNVMINKSVARNLSIRGTQSCAT